MLKSILGPGLFFAFILAVYGAEKIKVGIYKEDEAGLKTFGETGIYEALQAENDIAPAFVSEMSAAALKDFDVLIITKKGWKEPVARLKAGDFFGEMALLLGEPRSATVTAEGELEAFCLASVDFKRVAERSPDMTASLRQLAEDRRKKLAQS